MTRFISLIRFTDQGAREIKKSIRRAQAFSQIAEKAGVRIEGQYWTIGAYDGVLILSADNDQKVLHCLAELAASGNVHTETFLAFDANQFSAIAGK